MDKRWACFLAVVTLCAEFHDGGAGRILGIFPSPSLSHQLVFQTIMKALAARGHHVTVISTDPLKVSHFHVPHYLTHSVSFILKLKIKLSHYTPCRRFGGEEISF
jgi:hypothetical protein